MSSFQINGPHIQNNDTIEKNMWNVTLALIPASIVAVIFFGFYSLYLIFGTALSSVIFEKPFTKTKNIFGDGSAFLAGTLLGLTLAPNSPWWIPILGGFLTIVIAKQFFGGVGNNIFNPALVARAILFLSWPVYMTNWVKPMDVISSATPLAEAISTVAYWELFVGNVAGSIGETSALALLIGAIYLYLKGYIGFRIPLAYIISSALMAIVLGVDPIFTILSGGLLFGALFMATDMVTSPVAKNARVVYGIGCGVLTVVIREFTPYPEGVTFAILIMNGVSYLLDSLFEGPIFGEVKLRRKKLLKLGTIALATLIFATLVYGSYIFLNQDGANKVELIFENKMVEYFPEASHLNIVTSENDKQVLARIYEGENHIAYFSYIKNQGYLDNIEKLLVHDEEGTIISNKILKQNETASLGARIENNKFLNQFIGLTLENKGEALSDLDIISGATLSSRTVGQSVQSAMSLIEKDLEEARASEEYIGEAQGHNADIIVSVTVEDGQILGIDVVEHGETAGVIGNLFSELSSEILEKQSLDVDLVSGATVSSRGFLKAVENAIKDISLEAAEVYTGEARGHNDVILVSVIVEEGQITGVDVLEHGETERVIGDLYSDLSSEIIETQSLDIDLVSGATVSSRAFLEAVETAIADLDISTDINEDVEIVTGATENMAEEEYNIDEYTGEAQGHNDDIVVSVVVEDGEITGIDVLEHKETERVIGDLFEDLSSEIIETQSLDIDLVSGATVSSRAFLEALENALENK
ncbi:RnfABCDGE type electron transport complex subunit D [Natronospora cellulosivora (SeqCode)]